MLEAVAVDPHPDGPPHRGKTFGSSRCRVLG
jgi:hypothetical protein